MSPTEARAAIATGKTLFKALVATSGLPASLHTAYYVGANYATNTSGIDEPVQQHLMTQTHTLQEICQAMSTKGEFVSEYRTMEDQMLYLTKYQLSHPSDQNKWMTALTQVLQLDKEMTKVWGGTLLSQANLIKIASEERRKRQKVTQEACEAIFQTKNAIANWNLADGRTLQDFKMDMPANHKIAKYAAFSNPEPIVAEMIYVAAAMIIDIAQKQGSPMSLSQVTQNAVLQYLQTATDKEIKDKYNQAVKDRVNEDSVYVADPNLLVTSMATQSKVDQTGTGEWVHLKLKVKPDRKRAGEDQQVVPGKLAGMCMFNSHQDLLKGRTLGDCEDTAAVMAGFGHCLEMEKNDLLHIQRRTLASDFMPDDYKRPQRVGQVLRSKRRH